MSPNFHVLKSLLERLKGYADTEQDDLAAATERHIWRLCLEAISDREVEGLEATVLATMALKTCELDFTRLDD